MFTKAKFLKKFRERRDDGFTIVEAAITIPMLALMGGTMFFFMAQSLLIMQENNAAAAAGSQVKEILNEMNNATSCEDLNKIVAQSPIESNNNSVKKYTIEVTNQGLCAFTETYPTFPISSSNNSISIEAKVTDSKKVIYSTFTIINIKGNL